VNVAEWWDELTIAEEENEVIDAFDICLVLVMIGFCDSCGRVDRGLAGVILRLMSLEGDKYSGSISDEIILGDSKPC
jgi:hypothetical protein